MWYVGLDWADQHHDVVVLDEAGRRVGSRRVTHSQEGLEDLKQFLLGITLHVDELVCVVEQVTGCSSRFCWKRASRCTPSIPKQPMPCAKLQERSGPD